MFLPDELDRTIEKARQNLVQNPNGSSFVVHRVLLDIQRRLWPDDQACDTQLLNQFENALAGPLSAAISHPTAASIDALLAECKRLGILAPMP